MSFPTTPPVGLQPRPWSFPAQERRTLDSGLQLVAVRMPALPIVHVRWSFRAGRAHEPTHMVGAGQLLATTARHGTERWTSAELAEHIDHLGARLGVAAAPDNTVVTVRALSSHLAEALDIADEIVHRPTFPPADVDRERHKLLELIAHRQSEPDQLAALWLARALYGDHPYGVPSTTRSGLLAASRDDLLDLHRRLTDHSRGMLLVTGDVDPTALLDQLQARYDRPGDPGELAQVAAARPQPRRIIAVCREEAEQTAITVGQQLFARNHPDFLHFRVANQVLGAGASSRLFQELRERRSLTYGCYSAVDSGTLGGDLSASLHCANDKTDEAVLTLVDQLRRMANEPVGNEEAADARRYIVGSFPRKASGTGGVSALLNSSWLYRLPEDTWSTWQADVDAVTTEQIEAVSRRWIDVAALSVVAVGPREHILPTLEKLGDVEERNADDCSYEHALS